MTAMSTHHDFYAAFGNPKRRFYAELTDQPDATGLSNYHALADGRGLLVGGDVDAVTEIINAGGVVQIGRDLIHAMSDGTPTLDDWLVAAVSIVRTGAAEAAAEYAEAHPEVIDAEGYARATEEGNATWFASSRVYDELGIPDPRVDVYAEDWEAYMAGAHDELGATVPEPEEPVY